MNPQLSIAGGGNVRKPALGHDARCVHLRLASLDEVYRVSKSLAAILPSRFALWRDMRYSRPVLLESPPKSVILCDSGEPPVSALDHDGKGKSSSN